LCAADSPCVADRLDTATLDRLAQIGDVRSFAALVAREQLRRMGATLAPDLFDDLVSSILIRALQEAPRYDPGRGYAFTTFLSRRMRFGVTDWYRATFGDARYGPQRRPLADYVSLSPGAYEGEVELPAPEQEHESMADALVELGEGLSEEARWALREIGLRLAAGYGETEAVARVAGAGETATEARRRLALLRQELVQRGLAPLSEVKR
jgi:DNA-directed RNA polymerase specialized sigma24 family protein